LGGRSLGSRMAEAAAAETAAARLRKFAGDRPAPMAFECSAWNLDATRQGAGPERSLHRYLQHLDTSEIIHRDELEHLQHLDKSIIIHRHLFNHWDI